MSRPARDTPRPLARIALAGAAWFGVLNGLSGIVVFVLIGWLNRVMEDAPLQMGLWFTIFSTLMLASLFFELGIGTTIMQRPDLDDALLARLSLLVLAQGFIGSLAVWLLASPIAELAREAPQDRITSLVRASALLVALICMAVPAKAHMQRALRFRAVATIEASATLLYCAAGALLAPRFGVEGLVAATALRHGCEALAYWSVARFPVAALARVRSFRGTRDALGYAGAMAGQGLIGSTVRQGDTFLVLALAGGVAVGVWRQVQNFVTLPFSRLLVYVHRAAFPTFAKVQGDPDRLGRGFRRMQRLAALAVFPALAGLAAVSPRLLALFLGPQYEELLPTAVSVMRLLCIAGAFYAYAFSAGVVLNAAGHAGATLVRQALNLVVVFGAMAIGALAGFEGMAGGRALASVATAWLFVELATRRLQFSWRDVAVSVREAVPASLAVFAVASLVGVAADGWWPESAPTVAFGAEGLAGSAQVVAVLVGQVVIGVVAYGAALLLMGMRPVEEARALLGRAPKTPPAPSDA